MRVSPHSAAPSKLLAIAHQSFCRRLRDVFCHYTALLDALSTWSGQIRWAARVQNLENER